MKVLDNCQQKFRYLVGVGRALTMKYLWNVSSYRTNCDSDATLGRSVWQSLVFEEAQLAIYKQTNFKFFSLSVAPPRFKQKSWGSVQLAVNSTTQARYVTIEKEDVFWAKNQFQEKLRRSLLNFTKSRLARISSGIFGGLQVWVNSRKSFTILSHR